MPYKDNAELPESIKGTLPEHAQTIFRKAFNSASDEYGTEDEARLMKVAWAAIKNIYEKKEDKWALKKGSSAVSELFAISESAGDWIPIAKVGQVMQLASVNEGGAAKDAFATAEGFEMAVTLFNDMALNGYVNRNHSGVIEGLSMLEQKFEDPFLYGKFNSEAEAALRNPESNGRSIEASVFAVNNKNEVTHLLVTGVSVLDGKHQPACTPQMGCAEVKSEYHEGGGIRKMEKEEGKVETVTYDGEQTKALIATAIAEVTEKLDNAHAVELTRLKDEEETRAKDAESEHAKAVKEAEDAAFKHAQTRTTFMQKFSLKDDSELLKKYDEAKTLGDMQTLVNSMEIPTAAPAAAGISSAKSESEEPEVEKVEEIGNYDPIAGKYIPSYREEVKG